MTKNKKYCCKNCYFYKKQKDFCDWTRRNVKRYVNINQYSCFGYVNKKDINIRGNLYNTTN